jgi:hypothetical protein
MQEQEFQPAGNGVGSETLKIFIFKYGGDLSLVVCSRLFTKLPGIS